MLKLHYCEVIYFESPDQYHWASVVLDQVMTIRDVIQRLGWQIPQDRAVGIHSKLKHWDTMVEHLDRVEVYQPLRMTPNEIRLKRAQQKTNG